MTSAAITVEIGESNPWQSLFRVDWVKAQRNH